MKISLIGCKLFSSFLQRLLSINNNDIVKKMCLTNLTQSLDKKSSFCLLQECCYDSANPSWISKSIKYLAAFTGHDIPVVNMLLVCD